MIRRKRLSIDMARARDGVGAGHGFPLAARNSTIKPRDYQGRGATQREASHDHRGNPSSKGSEVETIAAEDRVSAAVETLGERRIGALPVVEDERIVGIISERDVIYCLRDHGAEVLDWPVSRVMSSPAITAEPRHRVLSALALMTQRRIRHLPVVEGGRIIGIVSIGDLVKHRMERIEAEAEAMRSYIQSA